MNMKNIIYFLLAACFFMACEEPYRIDEEISDPRVVIEGLVTNRQGVQFVKLSRSSSFYSSGTSPRISDAVVYVNDDAGNTIPFTHYEGDNTDSLGFYFPPAAFAGVIGRTYRLHVEVDGVTYEAEDKLYAVTPVDSLKVKLDAEEQADPEDAGRFYEVLIFAKEPQDEQNFYLFKFYRNDSLAFENDSDIYFSDDKLLAENIQGIAMPVYFAKGDTARVEAYSISRNGFVFYNDLSSLINNDSGGMFGPIPATPRTNLSNGALGFFQVSALNDADIIVE